MDLNQNYTLYNGGTRTKNTIKSFVRSDSGEVVRQIRLSKPLLDLAENVGIEVSSESLSEMLAESIAQRIKAEG
ncbi:MAG: hypothetical protein PHI56_09700 [Victivallaceae bacterium]|nr:hypothetical protein [Victivallaceae bacterium]